MTVRASLCCQPRFADLNTFDGSWSLLEVVVEGLDASPHGRRYVDQVMALEAGLAVAKEVDLKVGAPLHWEAVMEHPRPGFSWRLRTN